MRGTRSLTRPKHAHRWRGRTWGDGDGTALSLAGRSRHGSRGRGGGGGSGQSPDIDSFDWPGTKPAFVANGFWVTPEGNVWVERYVPAGEPSVFDVLGADAQAEGEGDSSRGSRCRWVGRGTIYLIETDDDGLQWLERHKRWEF